MAALAVGEDVLERDAMIIKIEQGSVGLWYASTEDAPAPYRGLFLTGNSCAEVLDDLSSTLKHLRELASTIVPALGWEEKR